jgi:hypothetical protein
MNRHESANKCFDAIMKLQGVDQFKAMVRRLRKFQQNGFNTIRQLANDVIFNLLESSISSYEISANMLLDFNRDSAYVNRIKALSRSDKTIGFDIPEEYSNEK